MEMIKIRGVYCISKISILAEHYLLGILPNLEVAQLVVMS